MRNDNFSKNNGYLIWTWFNKVFKGTVVNQALPLCIDPCLYPTENVSFQNKIWKIKWKCFINDASNLTGFVFCVGKVWSKKRIYSTCSRLAAANIPLFYTFQILSVLIRHSGLELNSNRWQFVLTRHPRERKRWGKAYLMLLTQIRNIRKTMLPTKMP